MSIIVVTLFNYLLRFFLNILVAIIKIHDVPPVIFFNDHLHKTRVKQKRNTLFKVLIADEIIVKLESCKFGLIQKISIKLTQKYK